MKWTPHHKNPFYSLPSPSIEGDCKFSTHAFSFSFSLQFPLPTATFFLILPHLLSLFSSKYNPYPIYIHTKYTHTKYTQFVFYIIIIPAIFLQLLVLSFQSPFVLLGSQKK